MVKSYEKLSHRNHKKDVNHLNKHAMHLLRLLMTGTQLLEEHVIVTRREEELPLLMKVRNGGFMEADGTMSRDFYEILDSCERRFQEAAKRTTLPDAPDMEDVGAFVESINRHAILAEG